jgi:Tetratricopeptide repeat/CobQ/CobB/MinD/ParA nucleotide binding domain
MSGSIITFYSYKGGTGRTMALANAACLLAAAGHKVLAIDWDLEAPGLHRYLHPFLADPELARTPGIIDLMWDYAATADPTDSTDIQEFDLSLADPAHVATPTSFPIEGTGEAGCLHMIGAGTQNTVYADRVRNFDWAGTFSRLGGAAFIRRFAEKCRAAYEFTLIDSRTGIADTAGIATILLPDRVVLCFTPNRQSVLGIRAIGDSIAVARPSLRLLPVVTRVEKGVEGWRDAQSFYRSQLDHLLPANVSASTRDAYWGAAEIVHYPNYALGELLATFCDSPVEQNSLLSDMRRLVSRIMEGDFMSSREDFPAPQFSQEARTNYSRRVRFRNPRTADLQAALDGDPSSGLISVLSLAADASQETDSDPEWSRQLASALSNLRSRLSNSDRREEAMAASREAVSIRRRLAETQDDASLFDLASSLNNFGIDLSNLGRREEALAASQEAVEIRRRLAQSRPDAVLPNLAGSLNNLAVDLSTLGRREEALAASQEATDIYRRLAQTQPDAFLSDLAGTVNNLGNLFFNLGRREEALAASQESVDIYRSLAQTQPDAFLPDLARSLNNLGSMLSGLGRREEALAASQQSVDIYRRLAQTRPDAFLPDLASSLNNFGAQLSDLGRREEALAASQEAVDIHRRLAQTRPGAFLPALTTTLNNLSNCLSALGRREEALTASQEAVNIRRRLAQTRPDAFLPDLASSLNNSGARLAAFGRREEALAASKEAVDIYRRLVQTRPDAFLPDLASSLNNSGTMLSNLNRREEALVASKEAVDIYRRLAQTRPDAFLPDLATSISVMSDALAALDRHAEAAQAATEALAILLPFVERYPEAHGELARVIGNDILKYSVRAGEEPDMLLLGRVAQALDAGASSKGNNPAPGTT